MYFWKIDALKRHLAHGSLSEKQMYGYMMAYLVFSATAVEMMRYLPEKEPNAWTYYGSMMNLLIPVVGTMMAFRANGGESGVQFLQRYMSISLVVTIRYMAMILMIGLPLAVLLIAIAILMTDFKNNFAGSPLEIVSSCAYALLYFFIVKHIREVATAQQGAAGA
ncbi:hypothetical protein ACO0K9_26235 [Undibacterium sp. Ji50W]|uniref:hypothetical protein n=1 Tax=Undibacterium sp. Ji50W TaxID=3413041 RepID=UPI003BF00786